MRTDFWQGGPINKQTQRQLFEQYGERLYRVAYRYLNDRMAAEDATSEAFVKIFSVLPETRFEHQNLFEAWLRRIVINQSLERLRRQKRWSNEQRIQRREVEDGEDNILSMLSLQELLQLIKNMPEGYRTVLQLYAFDGFAHREIAQALGISIGTSKSQLSKARSYLKQALNKINSL